MQNQLFIADAGKFDTDPACSANVWWPVKLFRAGCDQHRLDTNSRRAGYSDVPIVVMINGTHREHFLANEEGRFTVRELFPRTGQSGTNPSHPFDLFLIRVRLFR